MSSAPPITEPRAGRPRHMRLDESIVRATIDLIECGIDELTIAAIADRAGTTAPAIDRRWSSKAGLVLIAVFRIEVLTSSRTQATLRRT